jgi:hypothetical protein
MSVQDEVTATGHLPVMWPAAALDLGYYTRRLWSELQSVWAKSLENDEDGGGVPSVVPAPVGVRHALLALDGCLNQAELAYTCDLLARIDDLDAEVWEFVGGLHTEIFRTWDVKPSRDTGQFDFSGIHERTERLLPGMIEERRGLWDSKMISAWGELRLLSHRAVEGQEVLVAWWEVGFGLADVTPPKNVPGSPLAADDEGVAPLNAAIDRLPTAHQRDVKAMLPTVPEDDPRYTGLLHEAYIACRKALPWSGANVVPTTPQPNELIPDEDYRAVRLRNLTYTFSIMQAKMVKALHDALKAGRPGVSVERLFSVADSDRDDKRVQHVFRDTPALADGLLRKLAGGMWTLDLLAPLKAHSSPRN